MGRKSKRMALYEAIRQGQAKIAQGLENGQMRSDGQGRQNAQQQTNLKSASRQRLVGKSALLESQETAQGFLTSPMAIKVVMAGGALVIVILLVWLGGLIFSREKAVDSTTTATETPTAAAQPQPPVQPPSKPVEQKPEEEKPKKSLFTLNRDKEPKEEVKTEPEKPVQQVFESTIGKNVIVIQSIPESRKEILDSLKAFFDAKGVPTEVISDDGYAYLITRQGFEDNPNNYGNEGYQVLQKIKQLGLLYPQETADTKWGVRPFQDAYGKKRVK